MSRARVSGLLRVSVAATATVFGTMPWVRRDDFGRVFSEPSSSSSSSTASPPPEPRLDVPIAANYPATSSNKNTAQWRVYTDVARDLSARGDLEAAGIYLRRALAEAVAGFGGGDPHVAAARNNLAELYRLQKRWDEAEALFAEAADALEKHYGQSHPAAGAALHNLAGCKLERGDYAGAFAAYKTAAAKKAKALGVHHPDYATTLFHMAEAKRAGGFYQESVVLLEESLRVLDAAGQGETAIALRRMERAAQTFGELMGDHLKAEAFRRRVLEAREHAAAVAGVWESCELEKQDTLGSFAKRTKQKGFVGAAAANAHGGAVASAAEALSVSLAELGRWDEAVGYLTRAIEVHDARVDAVTQPDGSVFGLTGRGARSGGDYGARTAVDFFANALQFAYANAAGAVRSIAGDTSGVDSSSSKNLEAKQISVANLQMQLLSAKVKLADLLKRRESDAACRNRGEDGKPSRDESVRLRAALLTDSIRTLQPMACVSAKSLGAFLRRSEDDIDAAGGGTGKLTESATTDPAVATDDSRTVQSFLKRKNDSVFLEKNVAALVLFARAARGLLIVERERDVNGHGGSTHDDVHDASCHVGDAVEWLLLAWFATSETPEKQIQIDASQTRLRHAVLLELRECRAALLSR